MNCPLYNISLIFHIKITYVNNVTRLPSKEGPGKLSQDELDAFTLLERAVLVAIHNTHPIEIFDVPKQKKGYMDTPIVTDPCAYGIYPDLTVIENAGTG